MTAPDMVLVIGAFGVFVSGVLGNVLQILTMLKVNKVQEHTNGMMATMVKDAKEKGAQEEKDKQA